LKFSNLLLFYFILWPSLTYAEEPHDASPACARFRVHLAQELPAEKVDDPTLRNRPFTGELEKAINGWKERIEFLQDDTERARWLQCIRQFVFLDTNKNGIPDWTALVDGRPSRTLFPLDPDIDGDGVPNLFDPDPYDNTDGLPHGVIPAHLSLTGESGLWQKKLWLDLGILAINHTDEHLADTLATIYSTLQLDSVRKWKREVRGINVLYAFGHRSPEMEAAAYHPTANAISIPGRGGFGGNHLSTTQKCKFASSILHELGHALLFGIVSSDELREKAVDSGGWNLPPISNNNIWSPIFFESLNVQKAKVVSDYARTNVHEWFAESFAAYIWNKEQSSISDCQQLHHGQVSKKLKVWFETLLTRAQTRTL